VAYREERPTVHNLFRDDRETVRHALPAPIDALVPRMLETATFGVG
jgi:hypothetical protein